MKTNYLIIKNGLRVLLPAFCLLLSAFGIQAQTYVTAPMTGTAAPGDYYNNSQIVVTAPFHFTPSAGQYLHLYTTSDCIPLTTSPSPDKNYIIMSVPRSAMQAFTIAGKSTCDMMQIVQYFDGLGRPLQTVQVKGSPLGNDIVQPVAYDQFGREATKYLPYALTTGTSDGSYKTDALTGAQAAFYHPAGSTGTQQTNGVVNNLYPFAASVFEASPLNRVMEQGAPGGPWQPGSGHTAKATYGTNGGTDVILWAVNSAGNGLTGGNTNYTSGTLYVSTTTDENGNNTIEYKDKLGRVVCKKISDPANAGSYIATYYVYNDLGNLSYVIPPPQQTAAPYPVSIAETDAIFQNFIYGYHYDTRNRLIEKKIPGKGWEFMVYNRIDQPIFTQDAVQRSKTPQEWTYIKYDALGRVAITGIWSSGTLTGSAGDSNIASPNHVLQQWLISWANNNLPVLWVSRDGTQPHGYSVIDPAGPVLSVNYYDDYNGIPNLPSNFPTTGQIATGLSTVTKTAVLNTIYDTTPDMLYTAYYYDDLGRILKTYRQHYLGGASSLSPYNYDVVTINKYSFNNEVITSTREHYKNLNGSASIALTVVNGYTYDHMGRKIQASEQINGGTNVVLSQNDYNPIGQLTAKHLHSTPGAVSFLQDIKYKYNERGWLKRINDPANTPTTTRLFAEQLNYDSVKYAAAPNYNGNISEQDYFTDGGIRQHVVYTYDPLNRLTDGTSSAGFSEKSIQYDNLGNIKQLIRGANTGIYAYTNGSQLQSVTGITNSNYHYNVNGNADHDGRKNADLTYNMLNLPQTVTAGTPTAISITYTYDASGDKLRKVSNGVSTDYISGIQYKPDGTIDFIQTEEGRAAPITGGYEYQYTLTDHLGNNRVTFGTKTGVAAKLQVNDYYPFGLDAGGTITSPKNEYLYNKKELQEELGQYDYGARFYDPVIARWTSVDPLAEMGRRWSPYTYVFNNPMRFIDPDGMFADFFDVDGKKIGTDGIKNDQRLVVTDKNQAKQVEATNKAGGTTQIDDVSSAQFLPSTAVLNQSMKVLDAQVNGKTPNEKLPSLVTPTGTVVEGPTGGAPVVTTDSKGNPDVTVPSAVPAAPAGTTVYGSYINTTIHPHPTTGFTIGTAQFPAIPASGTLDAADASAFANHQTNIIVGRIGGSNGSLGIAIYHETTPVLNLTQKAVQKILTGK